MKIFKSNDHLQDWITQQWVKITGRRFNPDNEDWLTGPIGDKDVIKDKFFLNLAQKEDLEILQDQPGTGLLNNFNDLQLTAAEMYRIQPEVVDFYENTANYHFEVWSSWCGIFKPFGWLLSIIFSKRLQQLNLPLNPLHAAKGIKSSIVKLVDKKLKVTRWTIWYRILKSTNHVIYSGVYTSCGLPGKPGKYLKVIFPLPNGNATVIMRAGVLPNGALKLCSDGKRFGENGFYFTLTNHKGKHWAKFVRPMHEWITVYTDEEKVLRADHDLYFFGMPFLNLHYKMTEKKDTIIAKAITPREEHY